MNLVVLTMACLSWNVRWGLQACILEVSRVRWKLLPTVLSTMHHFFCFNAVVNCVRLYNGQNAETAKQPEYQPLLPPPPPPTASEAKAEAEAKNPRCRSSHTSLHWASPASSMLNCKKKKKMHSKSFATGFWQTTTKNPSNLGLAY